MGSSASLGFGFYEISWWGVLTFFFLALCLGLWIAQPIRPSGASLAALAGLSALWLWSLTSTGWAESADQALVDANRWLFYASVLAALILLLRNRALERLLIGAAVAPIVVTASYLLVRMAVGDGSELFLGNRLNEPLEYSNAMAGYLLVGFWPMVSLAEKQGSRAVSGAGLAAATMLAGLAAMSQSRGASAAMIVSVFILLLLIPGRVKRGWALLAIALGLVACSSQFGDVFAALPPGEVLSDDLAEAAARRIIAAAFAVGLLWVAASWVADRLRQAGHEEPARRASAAILMVVALAGAVVLSLPVSDRVNRVQDQYQAFTELRPPGEGTRLVAGGGNRYDYWRVAIDQYQDAPIRGIGAGNYDTTYYRERQTEEDIRNPHSVELQLMGETGTIGLVALLVFIAGVAAGAWARVTPGRETSDSAIAVAAGGAFLVWLVQTSVDWLHLVPGLTGVVLCMVAVLVTPSARSWRPGNSAARRLAAAGGVMVVAAASWIVALPFLSDQMISSGRDRLQNDPAGAVDRARDALAFNDESLAAYQLEAAGLARLGDYEGARSALFEATRREPSDYVTWALLGDLAARRGDLEAAQRAYGRAAALNPLEPRLAKLADDPREIRDLIRRSVPPRRPG